MRKINIHSFYVFGGILLNKGKSITFNTLIHWEEFHKRIILVLVSSMVSSLTSTFVAGKLLGIKPIFNLKNLAVMPLNNYLYLILHGKLWLRCTRRYFYASPYNRFTDWQHIWNCNNQHNAYKPYLYQKFYCICYGRIFCCYS